MNGDGFQIRPRARLACDLFTKPSKFKAFTTLYEIVNFGYFVAKNLDIDADR
jgi:hypothetical protein